MLSYTSSPRQHQPHQHHYAICSRIENPGHAAASSAHAHEARRQQHQQHQTPRYMPDQRACNSTKSLPLLPVSVPSTPAHPHADRASNKAQRTRPTPSPAASSSPDMSFFFAAANSRPSDKPEPLSSLSKHVRSNSRPKNQTPGPEQSTRPSQGPPSQGHRRSHSQNRIPTSPGGDEADEVDHAWLAMVHPLLAPGSTPSSFAQLPPLPQPPPPPPPSSLSKSLPPRPKTAAPTPTQARPPPPPPTHSRHLAHHIRASKMFGDKAVSPVTTPSSGNDSYTQYTVSPLSPDGSLLCVDTGTEPDRSSEVGVGPGSWSKQPGRSQSGNQQDRRSGRPPHLATSSGHSKSKSSTSNMYPEPLRIAPKLNKKESRHSDPGTPVNMAATIDFAACTEPGSDFGADPEQPADTVSQDNKVAFAMPQIPTFSKRSRSDSVRSAGPPPPLKLSERPLAGGYVKTPFPEAPLSSAAHSRNDSDASQQSFFDDSDSDDEDAASPPRSTRWGSISQRLRTGSSDRSNSHEASTSSSSASSQHSEGRRSDEQQQYSHGNGFLHPGHGQHQLQQGRSSNVPRVKDILSKAKHGLGMEDKAKKTDAKKTDAFRERKREDLKRLIKHEM